MAAAVHAASANSTAADGSPPLASPAAAQQPSSEERPDWQHVQHLMDKFAASAQLNATQQTWFDYERVKLHLQVGGWLAE